MASLLNVSHNLPSKSPSIHSTESSLSSSQCSPSQRTAAESNIVFSDGSMHFRDSWTCHIQSCSRRQRIIHCNTQQAACINMWSCQQCVYGGSHLQCRICASNCAASKCFSKQTCYAYLCSDSLRAYQCYYQSHKCHVSQNGVHTLSEITGNCKQCALNDQDVEACYICYNACFQHSCWNNCSINANFDLYSVRSSLPSNSSNTTHAAPGSQVPILLTENAIYGIIAMVGLICLIFGFWCGRNCSAHSVSKICCKWCVVWCDDDKYSEFDEEEDESAWNWKAASVSAHGHNINGKHKKYKKKNTKYAIDITPDAALINDKGSLTDNKRMSNNYQSTAQSRIGKNLRMRFPMTPLTSRELPRQQNVEQSPDVRVAHFATPTVATQMDDVHAHPQLHLMESIESDEEDAPQVDILKEILLKRDDSFDGFALHNKESANAFDKSENESKSNERERSMSAKRYAKDDMTVDDNRDKLSKLLTIRSSANTKRVISADSHLGNKRIKGRIIVLNNKRSEQVVSPPPITSKSEFQSLLRPTMSADAIALKKMNKK